MDYEQKYKEALERARELKNKLEKSCSFETARGIESIFPELKESEDESIRKSLIEHLQYEVDDMAKRDRVLDFEAEIEELSKYIAWLEKQDEKKPADKVEPRFKVGDWIVFNNDHDSIYQIEKIENYEYTLRHILGGSMPLSFSHGDMIRAWTIQDAKDGDVLVYEGEIFIIKSYALWNKIVYHCCYDGKNLHKHSVYYSLGREDFDKIHPATKLQRDLLFSKMN